MKRTRENIPNDIVQLLYHEEKSNTEILFESIEKLTGFELLELKGKIEKQFQKVIDREENFFLHDYIDNWFYMVNYEDESWHLFVKGQDAYREYTSNPSAVAITRKSKDLFPTYQTMMSKQEGYVYMPIQKGEKEMSKKEYDIQYQKDHTKRVYFVLNKDIDFDIINYLAGKDNVNGFLKKLIREQMRKERKEKAE